MNCAFPPRTPPVVFATWVVALVGLAVAPVPCQAQYRNSQEDISIEIDETLSDCPEGGYLPLPITIGNRGPQATVVLSVSGNDSSGIPEAKSASARKTLVLPRNATSRFSLLVPVVTRNLRFQLRVHKDGRLLEKLDYWHHSFSRGASGILIAISESRPDFGGWSAARDLAMYGGASGHMRDEPVSLHLTPNKAFETWLGYTAADIVAIDGPALVKLDEGPREELLRWVAAGGALVVYNVDLLENKLADVDRALNLAGRAATRGEWLDELETLSQGRWSDESAPPLDERARAFMFGRIVVTPYDPFKRDSGTWHRIDRVLGGMPSVSERNGANPRRPASDFLDFINPGIQVVPVWGFIVMITLFALAIGPINYLILKRRNRMIHLLWTTPLIAIVTTGFLLAWSSLANGTGSRVRLRSVTMLDQKSQTAVSITRAAIFAGVAPRGGMRFEPHTAVFPVWPREGAFQEGSVDWTDAQQLKGDFFRGNTRSQFLLITPRTLRGRLQFERADDGTPRLTNGLEWRLEKILVRGTDDRLFIADDVAPGQSITMKEAGTAELAAFNHRIQQQRLEPPKNVSSSQYQNLDRGWTSRGYYGYDEPSRESSFAVSNLERQLLRTIRRSRISEPLLPENSYTAIVAEPPDLDLGIERYSITEQLHILVGYYE